MTIHSPHPDSHTHGLADACPRCQEHVERPEASLDSVNLRRLLRGECYTALDRHAAARLHEIRRIAHYLDGLSREELIP